MTRHVEIFRSPNRVHLHSLSFVRQWRYRVVGANGEIMAPSQAYTRKASAKRAARALYPTLPMVEK